LMDEKKGKEWIKAEAKRLDSVRTLLDDAHARAKELLDEVYRTRLTLDPEGAELWRRIKADQKKDPKKDNILLHMADAVLTERAERCKAERLAVLLGRNVGRVKPRGSKAALEREFPRWKTTLKDYEERLSGGGDKD
jgi:hypothetical protein